MKVAILLKDMTEEERSEFIHQWYLNARESMCPKTTKDAQNIVTSSKGRNSSN